MQSAKEGRVAAAQRREPQQSPPQPQPQQSPPQSQRNPAKLCVKLPPAQSEPIPSPNFRSQPVPGWPELKRGLGLEWHTRSASRNAASLREAIS